MDRTGPGTPLGIDERLIETVVRTFYAQVREDPALMSVFGPALGDDWEAHLVKLCDFWSSVLLMTGRFKGTPMQTHARLAGIGDAHFSRWLALFKETVSVICTSEQAALFMTKAQTIGASLQMGIAASRGEMPLRAVAAASQ
jgi:hemoglobin